MTAKDWAFLSIAVLALCVSVATALFNVVLQLDDLRVVLGRNPLVEIRASELTVSGDQELTFIHSGNRAAAITDISAVARRIVAPGDEQVCHPPSASRFEELFTFAPIELDAKPFILKAGEILFVKTAIISMPMVGTRRGNTFYVSSKAFPVKRGDKILVCISLTIVTPDSYSSRWLKPIFEITLGDAVGDGMKQLFDKDKPLTILQRTSTVFSRVW